ncbi:CrcB family protein [Microbacterium sp. ISL-108]|nr:CrcB family protein [Microbacterium sp. ISL-108]RKN67393.1 CrcB family protein [Microbacterium sp. CGR2]
MTNVRLRALLLVAAGGTVGTAARLGLGFAIPQTDGFPLAVFVANVVGALLIGVLAARPFRALDEPAAADLRLLVGTGMLGGFTTYSAFTTSTVSLWLDAPLLASVYAVGSLALGLAAAAFGLHLGRPRPSSLEVP